MADPTSSRGRHPRTRIFIAKIASRCNLACTYCYMYQHADQSWVRQPRFMSAETVRHVAKRLEEHAPRIAPSDVMVVAHGGEPLLYPWLAEFFDVISRTVVTCRAEFAIQTNATLLDEDNMRILDRYGVRVGISLDGNREVHDRVRVTHDGRGSYENVTNGLKRARNQIPHLLSSILQVIDPSIPPAEMLDTLESHGVPRADLLFPDLNHDTFPASGLRPGQIGEWLSAVFDEWVTRPDAVHIRMFISLIQLLLGRNAGSDQFGASSDGALMIETDGSYHIYDGLKTAFEGAGCTGMSVHDSPITAVENLPLARAFTDKASAAAAECLACRLFPVCGGGSPIHRYSRAFGFDRPSVYCSDLMMLITHIERYLRKVRPNFDSVLLRPADAKLPRRSDHPQAPSLCD